MKNLIKLLTVAAMLFAVGCQKYNDTPLKNRVGELENRVTALEELCKKMNTNISSLQTIVGALQNNDYVTSVTPVTKNGETIGYTIAFSKSAPITIYHGENGKDGINGADGKDGVNGKDGHTPVIGVRQDSDGVYYWTLDGEWLLDGAGNKIKAEGRDGQNGSDGKDGINGSDGKDGQDGKGGINGSDGKDGENGKDGADGKDGITPQLKIENGYWFVSTDNGVTWTNLGKATGEDGKDGANGADGDSFFKSVTQDEDNVYFTLADGTIITIPRKPRLAISFAEGMSLTFDVDETKTVNYTISGGNSNNVVKAEMLNNDGNYTLYTSSTSATKGTIKITAKIPTANRVIVSVSDGNHTIMAAIDVTLKQPTITVTTPGTLAELIANYDKTTITELTVIGNLDSSDILTLKELPNLAVLDLENVHLEKLPEQAFYDHKSLTSVKLPISLIEIERQAFYGCSSLTDITIPESVTYIGNAAFYDCINLTNVYITDIEKWCTIKLEVGSNPLYYAHNLYLNGELVTDLVIPDSITSIGDHAFSGCSSITSITIPNSITFIGNDAFRNCNSLTSINIPDSVISIGMQAFLNCKSLTNVYITDITKWCAIEFHDNTSTPLGHTTHNYLYLNGELVTDLIIPDSVTSIGNYTFYCCISMKSITIPNSVTSIGRLAFYCCSDLININIPNSVMTIGYGAFMRCYSLTSVTIPDSVTSIGDSAFSYCGSLTSIYCKPTAPPTLGSNVFDDISSDAKIYVPAKSVDAYKTAQYWSNYADKIVGYEF